jgi:hypothetical protein
MTRLLNNACDNLTFGGKSYSPDETGAFNVPEDVAAEVLQHPGGFYRGLGVAPAARPKLAFNPVFNFCGGVHVNNDVDSRLAVLELAHFGSLTILGETPFVDSAGQRVTLSAGEARALSTEYRQRLVSTL